MIAGPRPACPLPQGESRCARNSLKRFFLTQFPVFYPFFTLSECTFHTDCAPVRFQDSLLLEGVSEGGFTKVHESARFCGGGRAGAFRALLCRASGRDARRTTEYACAPRPLRFAACIKNRLAPGEREAKRSRDEERVPYDGKGASRPECENARLGIAGVGCGYCASIVKEQTRSHESETDGPVPGRKCGRLSKFSTIPMLPSK
jgi:hypothetical protein